jgi:nucleoside-diphosphate-sugar epimerase
MRIFLAGASGAIGRRLVPLLCTNGHVVVGSTRSPEKAALLRALGAEPVVIDMFNAVAVERAIAAAKPEVVIHQLTDLPKVNDPVQLEAARARNARLREVATPILMQAAKAAGVRRVVVQSVCFFYAPGRTPHVESDPITAPSVIAMERAALGTAGIEGVVLRYGRLWGPGTWAEKAAGLESPLHVDAAANGAFLALVRGSPGVYNVAEDDGTVAIEKARTELGFDPAFRLHE